MNALSTIASLLLSALGQVQAGQPALLVDVPAVADPRAERPEVLRSRVVSVDVGALRRSLESGEPIELALFPDARFRLEAVRLAQGSSPGARIATAALAGDPLGSVTLAARGRSVSLSVRTGRGELYELRPVGGGLHAARQIDALRLGECGTTAAHAGPLGNLLPPPPDALAADGSPQIDVLVLYTEIAAAAAGGIEAMLANVDAMVADANQIYGNSSIALDLRLAHALSVEYGESGTMAQHLDRLTDPSDGNLDAAHVWRAIAGADLVALLVDDADVGVAGVAWLLDHPVPMPTLGFSVSNWSAAVSNFTFAHELGHNLGCEHDKDNSQGVGAFYDSYGWRFTGDSGTEWRTVMAYAPGTRIPYFSNPAVQFDGELTGKLDLANNAKAVNARASWVAGYALPGTKASPVYVDFTISASAPQTGAIAQPYDSLEEAMIRVATFGTIELRAGTETNTPALAWKPFRLECELPTGPSVWLADS